jgi:hypothetical protein
MIVVSNTSPLCVIIRSLRAERVRSARVFDEILESCAHKCSQLYLQGLTARQMIAQGKRDEG